MPNTRLLATGPDLYCPDCHRWLVKISESGTFDLASKAFVEWTIGPIDPSDPPEEVEGIPREAVCLRRRCRFKRWRRRAPKRAILWVGMVVAGLVVLVPGLVAQYGAGVLIGMLGVWFAGMATAFIIARLWLV